MGGNAPRAPAPPVGKSPRTPCSMLPSPTPRYSTAYVCVPPSFLAQPPSVPSPAPLYPWAPLGLPLGYPWAALPSQLPHTSRPTLAASPSLPHNIFGPYALRAGEVRAPARLPLRGSKHGAPFAARTPQSPRVLTPGRGCRKGPGSPAASHGWGWSSRAGQTRSSKPSSCAPGYAGVGVQSLQTSECMVRVGNHED